MPYRDVWPEFEWMEIFITCKLAGFDERTGRLLIDSGLPPTGPSTAVRCARPRAVEAAESNLNRRRATSNISRIRSCVFRICLDSIFFLLIIAN
jgi:hypothetical protein